MNFSFFKKSQKLDSSRIVNYFFIDYENVNDKGIEGIEHLERGDVLFVFHNETTSKMPIDLAKTLFALPQIGIEVKNLTITHIGRNALDMMLAASVGMMLAKNTYEKVNINIITKDKGLGSLSENLPKLVEAMELKAELTFQQASSILECYEGKKVISDKVVKTKKKKVVEPRKKVQVKKVENKKEQIKKEKTTSKHVQNQKLTKQQISTQLQHNKTFKKDMSTLRKKLINEGKLDDAVANKLANSITGTLVKQLPTALRYDDYLNSIENYHKNTVEALNVDFKNILNKY